MIFRKKVKIYISNNAANYLVSKQTICQRTIRKKNVTGIFQDSEDIDITHD